MIMDAPLHSTIFAIGFALGIIFLSAIYFLWKKFFLPEKIKVDGSIVGMVEDFDFLPTSSNFLSDDGSPSSQPLVKVPSYIIKVLVNNDFCMVKISYKAFKRIEKKFKNGFNHFSRKCEKYAGDKYFYAIESKS